MMHRTALLIVLFVVCGNAATPARGTAEIEAIKADPNLEKRAGRALEFARGQVDHILAAYRRGDPEAGQRGLDKILEAVELAHESLLATGKKPRRRPKHFKRAEIQTRRLLKQLDALSRNLLVAERGAVAPVRERVSEINDEILRAIMANPKDK